MLINTLELPKKGCKTQIPCRKTCLLVKIFWRKVIHLCGRLNFNAAQEVTNPPPVISPPTKQGGEEEEEAWNKQD